MEKRLLQAPYWFSLEKKEAIYKFKHIPKSFRIREFRSNIIGKETEEISLIPLEIGPKYKIGRCYVEEFENKKIGLRYVRIKPLWFYPYFDDIIRRRYAKIYMVKTIIERLTRRANDLRLRTFMPEKTGTTTDIIHIAEELDTKKRIFFLIRRGRPF